MLRNVPPPITARCPGINPIPIPIQTGIIVRVSLTPEEIAKHAPQVGNVGLGLELERATVSKVFRELRGTSLTEGGDGDGLLLLHDEFVLLGGGFGLEALPRESSLEEVDEDVADGFEVVTAGLFDSQVVVDGGVTRCAGEGAALALGNMLERSGVSIPLGQTEIDAVNEVAAATSAIGDKVGGFDVTVD